MRRPCEKKITSDAVKEGCWQDDPHSGAGGAGSQPACLVGVHQLREELNRSESENDLKPGSKRKG